MALGITKGVKDRRPKATSVGARVRRTLFEHVPMTGSGATIRAGPDAGGMFGGSIPLSNESGSGGHSAPLALRARNIVALLPALNEERAVGAVIERIPMEDLRRSGYNTYVWFVAGHSVVATLEFAKARGACVYVQCGGGKGIGVGQV